MNLKGIPAFVLDYARKATAAFLLAGLGALGTAMLDGTLTGKEAVAATGAGLVAAAGVFALKNPLKKNPVRG